MQLSQFVLLLTFAFIYISNVSALTCKCSVGKVSHTKDICKKMGFVVSTDKKHLEYGNVTCYHLDNDRDQKRFREECDKISGYAYCYDLPPHLSNSSPPGAKTITSSVLLPSKEIYYTYVLTHTVKP